MPCQSNYSKLKSTYSTQYEENFTSITDSNISQFRFLFEKYNQITLDTTLQLTIDKITSYIINNIPVSTWSDSDKQFYTFVYFPFKTNIEYPIITMLSSNIDGWNEYLNSTNSSLLDNEKLYIMKTIMDITSNKILPKPTPLPTSIEKFDDTTYNLGNLLTSLWSSVNSIKFLSNSIKNINDNNIKQQKERELQDFILLYNQQVVQLENLIKKDKTYVQDYYADISKELNPDIKLQKIKSFLYSKLN